MINLSSSYNPDVLSCIANLSNDEVFTPPEIANAMLDMLPQELFSDPNSTFLDPGTKSGVFLREIAKRLIVGLEPSIPDLQERIDHIFHNQLFGIAITELTSLLSRRSLYCSKYPNSVYSVSPFDNIQGNVRFKNLSHRWKDGKCVYCGVNQKEGTYEREGMEVFAYEFIHNTNPEEIFRMKFDVIIGNPPYQLNVGVEKENYGIPIYQKFVQQAKKLNPKYLVMITPSRWFTGGRGLEDYRKEMLNDRHIRIIVDYPDSKDCFPGVDISGGVSYFLWDRDNEGDCVFTNIHNGEKKTTTRRLNEFSIFPRYNDALSIIHKVVGKEEANISSLVSTQTPFGFVTTFIGKENPFENSVTLYGSKGISYVGRSEVSRNSDLIDKYKVIISKATCEHAGVPDRNGQFRVISTNRIIGKNSVCTQSYLVAGAFDTEREAENYLEYLRTKFCRFLLLQALTSQDISREKFMFVPMQDYSELWSDEKLYAKYNLSESEIALIDSMIRSMDTTGDENG